MCLSFDPRIGSNRHKFKTPLLLSKIVVGWTSESCIQALWRGSKRAFPDKVSGCSAPKPHQNLIRRGGWSGAEPQVYALILAPLWAAHVEPSSSLKEYSCSSRLRLSDLGYCRTGESVLLQTELENRELRLNYSRPERTSPQEIIDSVKEVEAQMVVPLLTGTRVSKGLTQRQLAQAIGCSQGRISKLGVRPGRRFAIARPHRLYAGDRRERLVNDRCADLSGAHQASCSSTATIVRRTS
jgi:hypothetical protein